ncbi:MAG: WbqC family protein [Wenyingzhuangia sp.]|uniref:WbqC family protein n=1 Tax=Wenyingzhuangia sp. TaxID=1964193 RepID=UPI0032194BCE
MIANLLVQPAYFAPIAHYAAVLQANTTEFETQGSFMKQTYQTRCYIYSANGKLLLNIPIKGAKGVKKNITEVELSYDEDWQKNHLRSLQSAYRTSPFYEYYESDLMEVFTTKHKYLWELLKKTNDFIMDALQETRPFTQTDKFLHDHSNRIDIRGWIATKKELEINFPKYVQMFDHKYGFIENLSVLDLLFMEGPNASMYLENLNLKHVI